MMISFAGKVVTSLLSLIAAVGLAWSISSLNDAEPVVGALVLMAWMIPVITFAIGIMCLLFLRGLLRSCDACFGRVLLLSAAITAFYVFKHAWDFPTADGEFYMLRDDLNNPVFIAPTGWMHMLTAILLALLVQFGLAFTTSKWEFASVAGFLFISAASSVLLCGIKNYAHWEGLHGVLP